jgi:NADH-quinone oxidoreductase subunit G
VRFTREISGQSELYVDGRGHREEIDIFPGQPLNNKLSVNVVDLCPVGALLDKDFLFKQRVWLLKRTPSISPADSGGENIWLEHNEGVIYRIKPRYNADVNRWWISDDTRYTYKAVHDEKRLKRAMRIQYGTQVETRFDDALEYADTELRRLHRENGDAALFLLLSPMMACEEAYLLGKYMRSIDRKCALVLGPVPSSAEDEIFRNQSGAETFRIKAEKVPNAAGIRRVMQLLGGPTITLDQLGKATNVKAGWIAGGYLSNWVTDQLKLPKSFKVLQDVFPTKFSDSADIVLPAAAWAEKDGCWENHQGRIQAFEAAVAPPGDAQREGDVYYKLLNRAGFYHAAEVRREMGEPFASIAIAAEAPVEHAMEFVEL